jgi:signal transduction histidine kinase
MSRRVAAERESLAARWLLRLREALAVAANDIFPSDHLLDHVPALVDEIAAYLSAPADNEIAANTAVMSKARELGQLRHAQHASVHQLLHEYEILGDILETFLVEETERLHLQPSLAECFHVQRRLTYAVRVLMRTTVDTFISEYTTTIQEQNERILAFNRAASHELRSPIGTLMFAGALLESDVAGRESAADRARRGRGRYAEPAARRSHRSRRQCRAAARRNGGRTRRRHSGGAESALDRRRSRADRARAAEPGVERDQVQRPRQIRVVRGDCDGRRRSACR